jgi:hypothetical protein
VIINNCEFDLEVYKYNNQRRKAIDREPLIVPKEKKNAGNEQSRGKVFVWDARDVTDHQIHVQAVGAKHGNYISLDTVSKLDAEGKPEHDSLFPAKVSIRRRQRDGGHEVTTEQKSVYSTLEVKELSRKVLTIATKDRGEDQGLPTAANAGEGLAVSRLVDARQGVDDYQPVPQKSQGNIVRVSIAGITISVIDGAPREVMCASVLDLQLALKSFVYDKKAKVPETRTQLQASLGHVQIDNLVGEENPVIFGPKNLKYGLITNEDNF